MLWSEFVRRHIGEIEADTFGDTEFDGSLALGDYRQIRIFDIAVSRHRVVRTPNAARRDDRGYVKIAAQLQGVGCFEQGGRRSILTPGEWSLYDATQTYALTNFVTVRQAAIFLPRQTMIRAKLDLDRLVARRFTRAGHAGRAVFDLIVAAQAALRAGTAPSDDLAEILADLVGRAALEQDGAPSDASIRDRSRRQALGFVAANLRDPSLNIDAIASALGCSKRYLHKLFEGEADTLNGLIWRQRLERARREFSDPAQAGRTITDIAFSWGFNSSSHFSRLFRDTFGVAPRRFRAIAVGGTGH